MLGHILLNPWWGQCGMQVTESWSWWHEHLSRGKGGSRHWAINESVHSSRIASLQNEGSGSSLIVEWGKLLVIDGWSPSRKSQLTYVIASLLMGGSRSANQTVNPVYKRGMKVWRIYLPPYPTLGVGRNHEKGSAEGAVGDLHLFFLIYIICILYIYNI